MSEELHILNLEDRPADSELVARELKREGIACSVRRVWTEADFAAGLRNPALGLILADYILPSYDGLSALKLARRERPEVPFIFVSGSLGEETAIDALHEGATDYVLKHRLNRLGPAVRRTLREARDRRQLAQAERQLAENEQRLRLLAENASDVIWTLDASGRLNYVSPSVQRLLGYTAEEVLSRGLEQMLVAASATALRGKLAETIPQMRAGRRVRETLELKYLCKDGWTVWCEVGYSGMFDASNGFVGVVGVSRDVSERRRAEEERVRLATAMEQAAEAVLITDAAGTIFYVNPAFEKISGYTRQEALGKTPRLLQSGKHDTAFYQRMWETITRGDVWHGRLINRKKDGALYQEDATISPVRDAAGRIVNFIALKLDVTREAELETQLRQSQKLESLGTLAGGVAHEINNPINGIMNYAQLMLDRLGTDHALREYAAEIIKETDRVSQIIHNLLSFARQDKRQHELAQMSDIINSTLRLIQTVMRHDQITLQVDVPRDLPAVKCHCQQIQQVFLNLLTNARDALNEKYLKHDANKIIYVTARLVEKEKKRWVRLTVEDHGVGVPPHIRDRVFDPFFTTKMEKGGTGLGLSISHGIVKEHRGQLHFETQTGQYTRFHLDLPVME